MTGTWIPKKHPSSALFLVADGRPLITRSVCQIRLREKRGDLTDISIVVDACHCVILDVHDLCRFNFTSDVW